MNASAVSMPVFDETCIRKTRCENRWTAAEDKILLAEVLKANGRSICWRSVAAALPGRNNKSCRKRWIHSLNPGLRKGRWTGAEDISLTAAVKVHGKHWFQVARMLGNGRTDDQCAKRWREALDPNIKRGPWGNHEDEKLITMFRIHGRKWNDIAASLDGRPPVQCRNRWLSLVRAGRLEDDTAVKPELREDSYFHPPAPAPQPVYHSTFGMIAGGDLASGHFPLRRTSWGDQTATHYDKSAEQPQLYPPTYTEGQYHEQPMAPPIRTVDLVGPSYYPSSHTADYSPSPHPPAEEVQPVSRSPQVFAPTPVNLFIQTNFTRVEHTYYYANQESDTSSGYESTPPPTTASSTRSSFSYSSNDSPIRPYDQTQENIVSLQSHPATHGLYLPYPPRHQYDAVDNRCYHPSPLTEHGTSPYHSSPDGELHPHAAYCTRNGQQYANGYESTDRDCGYESEPESDEGWGAYPIPGHGFYATPNQATAMWRHPSWFHPGVIRSDGNDTGGSGTTNGLVSAERTTDYDVQSC